MPSEDATVMSKTVGESPIIKVQKTDEKKGLIPKPWIGPPCQDAYYQCLDDCQSNQSERSHCGEGAG